MSVFDRGILTRLEFAGLVIGLLTAENVADFLLDCPRDLLEAVQGQCDLMPEDGDDTGWGSLIYIRSVCQPLGTSEADPRRAEEEYRAAFRNGVRVFRAAVARSYPAR